MYVLYAAALRDFDDASLDQYLSKVVAVVFGESTKEQAHFLEGRIGTIQMSGTINMVCCHDEDDSDLVTRARSRQERAAEIYLPTLQVPGRSGNGREILLMQIGPNETELARQMFHELSPHRRIFQAEVDKQNPVIAPVLVVPHSLGPRVTWTYAT